jgi:hypothetical protein
MRQLLCVSEPVVSQTQGQLGPDRLWRRQRRMCIMPPKGEHKQMGLADAMLKVIKGWDAGVQHKLQLHGRTNQHTATSSHWRRASCFYGRWRANPRV